MTGKVSFVVLDFLTMVDLDAIPGFKDVGKRGLDIIRHASYMSAVSVPAMAESLLHLFTERNFLLVLFGK